MYDDHYVMQQMREEREREWSKRDRRGEFAQDSRKRKLGFWTQMVLQTARIMKGIVK